MPPRFSFNTDLTSSVNGTIRSGHIVDPSPPLPSLPNPWETLPRISSKPATCINLWAAALPKPAFSLFNLVGVHTEFHNSLKKRERERETHTHTHTQSSHNIYMIGRVSFNKFCFSWTSRLHHLFRIILVDQLNCSWIDTQRFLWGSLIQSYSNHDHDETSIVGDVWARGKDTGT
jgi:hypothetical protein